MDNSGGFDPNYLARQVGTDFPTGEFTVMWHFFLVADRASQFQTYAACAKSSFAGDNEYIIFGFDGSGGVSNNMAIGSQGNDTYAAAGDFPLLPPLGRWVRQAFVRRDVGGGDYDMDLYLDLALKDKRKITRTWSGAGGAFAVVADSRLTFGNTPYNNAEGIDGWMRCCKLWSRALSEADIITESQGGAIFTSSTSLYGQWPMVSDGNDISGNARHLTTAGTVSFDDAPDPPLPVVLHPDFSQFPRTLLARAA